MTKKEKEELERKQRTQRKRNKGKNIAIFILVLLLLAVIAFFLFKEGIIPFGGKETTAQNTTNSVSDTYNDYSNNGNNNTPVNNEGETKEEDEDEKDESSTSDEDTTDETESEKENNNDGKVYAASLPLTDTDAIAILKSRYGSKCSINKSTQNGAYTNYAVFKDDDRYATVSVNLSTGEATEIIMDSGKQTTFNLL